MSHSRCFRARLFFRQFLVMPRRCFCAEASSGSSGCNANSASSLNNDSDIETTMKRRFNVKANRQTEVERALNRRRYNPKDQFGTLSRDSAHHLQTERLEPRGFENPWLQGVDILERERLADQRHAERLANKFATAPKVLLPYRERKKMERQQRKELSNSSKSDE